MDVQVFRLIFPEFLEKGVGEQVAGYMVFPPPFVGAEGFVTLFLLFHLVKVVALQGRNGPYPLGKPAGVAFQR